MSSDLIPRLTRAGLAAVRNAQGTGLQATIAQVAVGRGLVSGSSYVGYVPQGTETALVSEQARVPLLSGTRIGSPSGSDPLGFSVLARVSPASPGFPVNEVGFLLADGTLLALWSDPAFPLAFLTPNAALDLRFDLFLQQLPTGSVAITVTEPDIPDTAGVLGELLAVQANTFAREVRRMTARLASIT